MPRRAREGEGSPRGRTSAKGIDSGCKPWPILAVATFKMERAVSPEHGLEPDGREHPTHPGVGRRRESSWPRTACEQSVYCNVWHGYGEHVYHAHRNR